MMGHPLEEATGKFIQEQGRLRQEVGSLTQQVRASEEREAILKGRIETLDRELAHMKDRSDYYLRVNTALLTQLDNIEMFVKDALRIAGDQVEKGNGKQIPAIPEVEKAIMGPKP